MAKVSALPGLSSHAGQIAGAIQSGQVGHVIGKLPGSVRPTVELITRSAFTTGLNRILLVAAIIAFASGLISVLSIRSKDFVTPGAAPPGG